MITGASRGIGEATARRMAEEGASLVLTARSEAALISLRDELRAQGARVEACPGDVADKGSLDRLVDFVSAGFGRVDILVNNAGVLPKAERLERQTWDGWRGVLDVNLNGVWYLSCRCKELMTKGGVIVNVTSTAAHYPSVGLGSYCVSKTALIALTRACALEWAPEAVRVLAVAPGKVATELARPVIAYHEYKGQDVNLMKRIAEPAEIADVIAYLVSERAAYITGSVHVVDGGELVGRPA